MTPFLRGVARAVLGTFDLPEPILEVGSYQVAGQERLCDLRSLLPGKRHIGLDVRPGPGVDLVGDVERLDLPDASVGTVLAFSVFEHVPRFWRGFDEVFRVLKPDGAFVVSVPFHFRIHRHPSDYWRFTPDALEMLLERYPSKLVGWHGPRKRPENVWAVAYREGRAPIGGQAMADYRAAMGLHARQPMGWLRRLRCALGRLVAGRVPFAPALERENWSCDLHNRPVWSQLERAGESRRADRPAQAPATGVGVHRELELPGAAEGLPALARR